MTLGIFFYIAKRKEKKRKKRIKPCSHYILNDFCLSSITDVNKQVCRVTFFCDMVALGH